ncbi:hypothetical protein BpHYR1_022469 [Brachionus plicatilis]|uniref:Uncharacterized protein n=1 Tax=Brachionus plicatilis TaxID=10195 RepID=A0A3M7PU24_BRAPC|nr:hypothetical protein BpHYR1_022469 [Brachionus plicatilis]
MNNAECTPSKLCYFKSIIFCRLFQILPLDLTNHLKKLNEKYQKKYCNKVQHTLLHLFYKKLNFSFLFFVIKKDAKKYVAQCCILVLDFRDLSQEINKTI